MALPRKFLLNRDAWLFFSALLLCSSGRSNPSPNFPFFLHSLLLPTLILITSLRNGPPSKALHRSQGSREQAACRDKSRRNAWQEKKESAIIPNVRAMSSCLFLLTKALSFDVYIAFWIFFASSSTCLALMVVSSKRSTRSPRPFER